MNTSRPNPYVGPRAFRTGEKLYGRDRECLELLDLLVAERILLLYSPSGAGKTSLIRSALVPKLEAEGFRVLPVMRVGLEPPPEARPLAERLNRHVLSAILSLEERLSREEQRPIEELAGMELGAYLGGGDESEVLIFDQFEEILTVDPANRAAKEDFFLQVGKALRERGRWALFAMREDYLAGLDPYRRRVPTRLATRFRLDLLEERAAREAIQAPARAAGVEFADEAARRLTDDLRRVRVQQPDGRTEEQVGLYIEPVQLQVVCHRLWEKKIGSGTSEIVAQDVEAVGDVDSALAGYYAESVSRIARETGVSERTIREWCDSYLITASGIRGQVLQGEGESEGLDNRAIWALVDTYLLRGEKRRGATWFELAHDRLIAPVRKDNEKWRQEHLSELQRRAALWQAEERPEGLLLKGKDLAEAKRWAAEHASEVGPIEGEYLEYSSQAQARAERERKQARRIRRLAIVSAVVAAVAVVAGAYGWFKRNEAEGQKVAANHRLGTLWWERAQAYEMQGDFFSAKLMAAKAIGFEGFGRERLSSERQDEHAVLLQPKTPEREAAERFLREGPSCVLLWQSPLQRHHMTEVTAIAFSPDSRTLASGSKDGAITLWDIENGSEEAALDGHGDSVLSFAFDGDGKTLASGGEDGTIKLWDTQQRKEQAALRGHGDLVSTVAFSPDGKILASGSQDGRVKLWEVKTGKEKDTFSGNADSVTSVAFSPDGKTLAWGNEDGTIELRVRQNDGQNNDRWGSEEKATHEQSPLSSIPRATDKRDAGRPLTGHISSVESIAFSLDGGTLASGDGGGLIKLWDIQGRKEMVKPSLRNQDDAAVLNVAFSRDGTLAWGTSNGTIELWNIEEGKQKGKATVAEYDDLVSRVAFSRDGKTLARGGKSGKIEIWDIKGDKEKVIEERSAQAVGHGGRVLSVAFSPDGRTLASGSRDHTIKLWNVAQGKETTLTGHGDHVMSVIFSPDGTTLASGSKDGTIKLWDVVQGKETMHTQANHVMSIAYSPDGRTLVSGSRNGRVNLWDVAEGKVMPSLKEHTRTVTSLAFSPDGKIFASAGDDGIIKFRDEKADEIRPFIENDGPVLSLAFSPDGKTLAGGTLDGVVKLWDAQSKQDVTESRTGGRMRHGGRVWSVAFSPDRRTLASASEDGTVKPIFVSSPEEVIEWQ